MDNDGGADFAFVIGAERAVLVPAELTDGAAELALGLPVGACFARVDAVLTVAMGLDAGGLPGKGKSSAWGAG